MSGKFELSADKSRTIPVWVDAGVASHSDYKPGASFWPTDNLGKSFEHEWVNTSAGKSLGREINRWEVRRESDGRPSS
jgi:hypothetical protein